MVKLSSPIPRPEWGDGGRSDNWSAYLNGSPWSKDASPFEIPMPALIRRAEKKVASHRGPPLAPRLRVTDFAKWIFGLYAPAPTSSQLQWGRRVEATISLRRG